MGKFVKGQSGNPKGRPKSEKKNNEQLRSMIREFISGNMGIEEMQKDFDSIEKPEIRFKIRQELLKMLLPDPVNPEHLTTEQLQELVSYLEQKRNEEILK